MIRLLRFSAFNLALGYIALSIAVLMLFATPLGIAWREGITKPGPNICSRMCNG